MQHCPPSERMRTRAGPPAQHLSSFMAPPRALLASLAAPRAVRQRACTSCAPAGTVRAVRTHRRRCRAGPPDSGGCVHPPRAFARGRAQGRPFARLCAPCWARLFIAPVGAIGLRPKRPCAHPARRTPPAHGSVGSRTPPQDCAGAAVAGRSRPAPAQRGRAPRTLSIEQFSRGRADQIGAGSRGRLTRGGRSTDEPLHRLPDQANL